MSFFSRLFGSGEAEGSRDLEAEFARLEAEAERARPGYQGTPYNKAGDVALRAGDKDRAVAYYGRAIDAFLEDQQREAARGVANKIIRVHPRAVRTLCTLTWLDLAARHKATALQHLHDYVAAAATAGEHDRAADQIFEMARIAPQVEFVDAVADALDTLGFDERAAEVRAWVRDGGAPDALQDTHALIERCLSSAVDSARRGPPSE